MTDGREEARVESAGALSDESLSRLFVIGEGGMGTVEAAIDHGADPERVVAVKRILKAGIDDSRRREMFAREAHVAVLLRDPRVVRAYSYGETPTEFLLSMEYVDGEPLSAVLAHLRDRGEALAPGLAAWILAEVCEGLAAAHDLRSAQGDVLGVVHRDVSPQNVLLGRDGSVRLLDFGVAKANIFAGATRAGEVKGKTAYIAPEQALGNVVDGRSDLFSVGAVLFESLTGRTLWGDATDMEVLREVSAGRVPVLTDVFPHATPELAALSARLLAAKPDDRLATAREAAEALAAIARSANPEGSQQAARTLVETLCAESLAARDERMTEALVALDPAKVEAWRRTLTGRVPAETRSSGRPSVRPSRRSFAPLGALGGKLTVPVVREAPIPLHQSVLTTPMAVSRDRVSVEVPSPAGAFTVGAPALPSPAVETVSPWRRVAMVVVLFVVAAAAYWAGRSAQPNAPVVSPPAASAR